MGFATVDYAIVALYLVGVTVVGIRIAGKQRSSRDYFLGGKQMSWWSVGFSIVASETSTLTFISVPGLAFRGNMHFLQLAFGYFVGRLLVSVVFIPAYYRGDLETAYDFLGRRFGPSLRKFTSSVFLVTRVLASGVRLFATAIPVHLITGLSYAQSILLIGTFTLVYTYVGGLKAVVAMDVVQMFIYMSGAVASLALILHRLPGGWSDVVRFATQGGIDKFEVLNLSYGGSLMAFLSSPYTLLGGLLGGTFLTMASHGTDQLLVQRLLGCRSRWDAQRALMLDAAMIVAQFAFFLVLGVCLYAFYGGVGFPELGLSTSDEVFPKFIVENLPSGVAGLVVAGVLASAMGTLSSSISSLASSTYLDLFKATARGRSLTEKSEMLWSKAFTLFWGVVLIGGALLFTDSRNPVVELGLKIASFTYGGLLGTFFLGMLFPRVRERDAYFGFLAGILTMIVVLSRTSIDFTWHTLIGCVVTIAAGNASRLLLPGGRAILGVAVAALSLAPPLEASWGEIYATSIRHDLNNWAAGWTDWNVLLDERGGPNHVGNFCLAPVHGDTRTGQLTYTSSYWYIGHVSRFVRPGARRIACTSNDDDLLASAFVHPGGRVVTVVLNKTDVAKDVLLWTEGRAARVKSPAHSILTLESTTGPGATSR